MQPNVLTPACIKHSWKCIQKIEIVTAVLSYEQINVRNGAQRGHRDGSPWDRDQDHDLLRTVIVSLNVSVSFIADLGAF